MDGKKTFPAPWLLAVALLFCSPMPLLTAAEAPEGAVKVSGKVRAGPGGRLRPRAAKMTARDGQIYKIVLDPKGCSLVNVMHGTSAEVWGVPSKKDGADWLRVLDYTEARLTEAHELWRRMRCNACVVFPAVVNSMPPDELHGARPITGRYYSFKGKITAWTRKGNRLWVATDNQLHEIDLAARRLVRSYDRKDGLPDRGVYQLACDGKTLWIVYRGGVAALKPGGKRIAELPRLKSRYARALAGKEGTWIITEVGTFRLKGADAEPESLPAIPTAERIAAAVEKGIWIPHWDRRTAHFASRPGTLGGRLYVESYGSIYELAGGKWSALANRSWGLAVAAGRVWFLSAKGLTEYDPRTKKNTQHQPPAECRGRCIRLLPTDQAVWVAAEPLPAAKGGKPTGGGLSRFELAERKWQPCNEINGHGTAHTTCLRSGNGHLWALTSSGRYTTKSAHPGMTYVKSNLFETTGFHLHRLDAKTRKWESTPLKLARLEQRLICGQDGMRGSDKIIPGLVKDISVGRTRVFGWLHLVPEKYFGGYWPCINQVASRPAPGAAWTAKFEHAPAELNLQGEQPLALNISNGELIRSKVNPGQRVLEAVGHDGVLGLFPQDGRHWAVTEGCVACFDEAEARWQKVLETGFRFYWRATAALEDGRSLYVGSDRGLIARLDFETGLFQTVAALKDRTVSRLLKKATGEILAGSEMAPLGVLPAQLRGRLKLLDCDVAGYDGKEWRKAEAAELPAPTAKPKWFFKRFEKRKSLRSHFDKSHGNFLCGPAPGDPQAKPRCYVKEIFFPQYLCSSPDGERMWLSTFTGLLRLDFGGQDGGGK